MGRVTWGHDQHGPDIPIQHCPEHVSENRRRKKFLIWSGVIAIVAVLVLSGFR